VSRGYCTVHYKTGKCTVWPLCAVWTPRGVLCEPWDWFILVQTWAGSPQGIWTRAMSQRPPGFCTPALRIRCWPPRTGTTTKIVEGYVKRRRQKTIIFVWSSGRTKASSFVVKHFLNRARVQGFLSSRTNWVPQPLTGKRVMPPRGSKGGRHTRLRGRGVHGPMGDIQFRRRDIQMLWYSRYTIIPLRIGVYSVTPNRKVLVNSTIFIFFINSTCSHHPSHERSNSAGSGWFRIFIYFVS
jgi:hypothetical protein